MKYLYKEHNLLKLIRYGAIVIILLFSFSITTIFVQEKKSSFLTEIEKIEKSFIEQNKVLVKNLVNRVHNMIKSEQENMNKELREKVLQEVEQAYNITKSIYDYNKNQKDYSKEKTISLIKEALRNMRFDNSLGYMFIYELNGKAILNAEFPELEGKNLWTFKDSKGTPLLQEMNKILSQKNETFYSWYWEKPKEKNIQYKKLGFFKKFEPYGIFIGTGVYVADFEKQLQERLAKKLNHIIKKPEHIFVYDKDGLCLVNPKKNLVGINRYNSQNRNGRYVLREILEYTLKNKEGFIRYKGSVVLNKENQTNDKISYVKLFDDWQWIIGSGFYLEELYKEIDSRKEVLEESLSSAINKVIMLSSLITLIMIILSFYVSNVIANIFKNYKEKIEKEMKNSLEKEKLLVQQSKMATMGEMIGNIAHQWKQPLSVISMSNSLLKINQEEKGFSSQEEIDEALKNVDNSIAYLSETIDDFRNFFRPNKTKEYFHIEDAIAKTCNLVSSQFKNNDIKIVKNLEDVEVYSLQNELLQVLINIVKNAKEELVKLKSAKNRLLFIDVTSTKESVIIKIKDNAGGIEQNLINKIFEAYFTTKEEEGGTGIGLYMSKEIITGLDGTISVSNEEFEYEGEKYFGAQFTIELPKKIKE